MTPSRIRYKAPTPMNEAPGVSSGSPLTIDIWSNKYQHPHVWLWRNRCSGNRQNQGFSPFLWPKLCSFVVVIGVKVHLGMAFININSIKYKICKYLLKKHEKPLFSFSHWKVQADGSQWLLPPTFDFWQNTHWTWYLRFVFLLKWPQRMNLQLPINVW